MQRRAIKTQTGEGNGNICGGGLLKTGQGEGNGNIHREGLLKPGQGGKWEYDPNYMESWSNIIEYI